MQKIEFVHMLMATYSDCEQHIKKHNDNRLPHTWLGMLAIGLEAKISSLVLTHDTDRSCQSCYNGLGRGG